MREIWEPIVKSLTIDDVMKAIPSDYKRMYNKRKPSLLNFNFKKTESIVKYFDRERGMSHQKLSRSKTTSSVYLSRKAKRLSKSPLYQPRKHFEELQFIVNVAQKRWEEGLPIEMETLALKVVNNSKRLNMNSDFVKSYCNNDEQSRKKLNVIIKRVLGKHGLTVRKKTVSQSIPKDWRTIAIQSTSKIRQQFRKVGVSVVLSADETFIRFNESSDHCIAPKGIKRVGFCAKENEKGGVTLLPTLDMTSSRLLPPLIIFKAKFGARLMKDWSSYTKSFVVFTDSHWMTQHVMLLYFEYLMKYFPGQKIGLIIDSAQQHVSRDLHRWLEVLNERNKHGSTIYLAFIERGLTAIYQPGDVMINKPLKQEIRKRYYDFVSQEYDKVIAERKVKVSREKLVEFIEGAFKELNLQQFKKRTIANAFDICGLNPYSDDLTAFYGHLDNIEESKCYAAMIEKRTALDLK